MHRLKNAYRGERAAVIVGGTSLIACGFDFERLRSKGLVTFLETKALTSRFVASGLQPDFFLMLFPEKARTNAFHDFVYRLLLAGSSIESLVRPEFRAVARELRERFDEYFEPWRPQKGVHKRYRWRSGVRLENSPYELLAQLPSTKVLANGTALAEAFPDFVYPNERYVFGQPSTMVPFNVDDYYTVRDEDDRIVVGNFGFLNSAAIVLYPLLHYMGFRTVYFLGMDMSMLGTMEYGAPFTFKSMLHYRYYFWRTKRAFNADYKQNRPWYVRPQSEFDNLKALLDPNRIDLVRVHAPYKYAAPIPFMHTIDESEFWRQ